MAKSNIEITPRSAMHPFTVGTKVILTHKLGHGRDRFMYERHVTAVWANGRFKVNSNSASFLPYRSSEYAPPPRRWFAFDSSRSYDVQLADEIGTEAFAAWKVEDRHRRTIDGIRRAFDLDKKHIDRSYTDEIAKLTASWALGWRP